MSSAPSKSAGDARHMSQDQFIQLTLTPICIRSTFIKNTVLDCSNQLHVTHPTALILKFSLSNSKISTSYQTSKK